MDPICDRGSHGKKALTHIGDEGDRGNRAV